MTWIILSLLAAAAAVLFVLAYKAGNKESHYSSTYWTTSRCVFFWTAWAPVVAFLILGGIMLGVGLDRKFAHESCTNYGAQTGRDVKWVDASYFDYGCYVKWNGKWVPRDSFLRLTFGQETES